MSTTVTLRTCDLIGAALDWAVAQVCVAQGSFSVDPHDAKSGLPYMTFDAGGPSIWGAGREQRGTVNRETGKPWVFHGPGGRFEPSTDWSQGGPLIEKHHVQTSFNGCGFSRSTTGEHWCAYACKDNGEELRPSGSGPTPLIAACRAIVSAHLGDSVDVPAELVGGGV